MSQRLCINCKHYRLVGSNELCSAILSPVNGKPFERCRHMRFPYGECKPQGILFEKVEPMEKEAKIAFVIIMAIIFAISGAVIYAVGP